MLWCVLTAPWPTPVPSSRPEAGQPGGVAGVDWPALACWAGRYTPRVAIGRTGMVPALYFEVSGSLRLFGGREALLAEVRAQVREGFAQGVLGSIGSLEPQVLVLGIAPRPRAALWLARSGIAEAPEDLAALRTCLRAVPLAALPVPDRVAQRLTGFGLRTLGQVLDLPRAALATRLGAGFVLDLAKALGEVEDPLRWFVFPENFVQLLELPAPVEAAPALLFACRRLLAIMTGWLSVRNAAVSELRWHFGHGRGQRQSGCAETLLPLHFSEPVHAPERIERILAEALGRLVLTAPVLSLTLEVRSTVLRDARTRTLFAGTPSAPAGETAGALAELIDRLHARLGEGAVTGLRCHADHRPERATREVGAGETAVMGDFPASAVLSAVVPNRPLGLFAVAQPLREHHGRPWLNGPLRLLAGPERIESGWWDGGDVARDYFVALDAQQRWCWIYRSGGESARWYLHGLFA